MNYTDKFGKTIEAGMLLKDSTGEIEVVFGGEDGSLGVNASNENYTGFSDWNRQIFPLEAFDSDEFEIVNWETAMDGKHSFGNITANNLTEEETIHRLEAVLEKFGVKKLVYTAKSEFENLYRGDRSGEDVLVMWDFTTGAIFLKAFNKQP